MMDTFNIDITRITRRDNYLRRKTDRRRKYRSRDATQRIAQKHTFSDSSMEPVTTFGWNVPDTPKSSGVRDFGQSCQHGHIRKSVSALSLALSESDASSIANEDEDDGDDMKSYTEALATRAETEDCAIERSENARSFPVDINWPRGQNKHPRRRRMAYQIQRA